MKRITKTALLSLPVLMITPSIFAQNIEVIRTFDDSTFSIDKDTIEKRGSYYQALLINKLINPLIIKDKKYDQSNFIIKYDCANNAQFIVRVTNLYEGRQTSDWLNPKQETFDEKDNELVDVICQNYLIQDKSNILVSENNGITTWVDKNTIKKFGQYGQVKLVLKLKDASTASNGTKFDQLNIWLKYDCKNNLEQFMRITRYYQGKQIIDMYPPTEQEFEESTTAKNICEKYLR